MAWNISKAKRQALVKLQLRDKNGKFIEMGGGVKWYSSRLRKVVSGTVVGTKGENALIRLNKENPTHEPALVSVPARSIEPIKAKASLPGKGEPKSNLDTPEFEEPAAVGIKSKGDDEEIDGDTESDHERSVSETSAAQMRNMPKGTVIRSFKTETAGFIKQDDDDSWQHILSNGTPSGNVSSSAAIKNHDGFYNHVFSPEGTPPVTPQGGGNGNGSDETAPAAQAEGDDSAENYAISETSDGNTYISKKDGSELYFPARQLQVGDEVIAPSGADPTKPFSIGRNWATKGAERLNTDGPVIGKVIAMEGDRYAVVQMADGHTIPDRRNPDETTDTVTIGLSNRVIKATPALKEALGDKLGEGNYGDRPSDEDQEITDNDPQAQSDHEGREATPEQIAEEEAQNGADPEEADPEAPEAVDPATAKPVLTHRITGAAKDELEFGIETMESDGVDPGVRMNGSKAEVYDVEAAIFTIDGPLGVLDDNLMGDVYKGSHKAIAKAKQRGLQRFRDVLTKNQPTATKEAAPDETPEAVEAPESAPDVAPAPETPEEPEAPAEVAPEAPEPARRAVSTSAKKISDAVAEIEQDTEDIDTSGITGEDFDAALEEAKRDILSDAGELYTIVPIRDNEGQWNYGLADANGKEVGNWESSEYDTTGEIASEINETVNGKESAAPAKAEPESESKPEEAPAEEAPAPAEKPAEAPESAPEPEEAPESTPKAEKPAEDPQSEPEAETTEAEEAPEEPEELAPPLDVDVTPNRAMPGSIRVQSNKNKKILSNVGSLRTGDRVFPIGTPDKPYGTHSNYSGKSGFVHTNYEAGIGTVVSQHGGFAKVLGEDGNHYYPTHHFVALKATPELEAEVAAVNERYLAESAPSAPSTPEASAPETEAPEASETGFLNGYDIDTDTELGEVKRDVEEQDFTMMNTSVALVTSLPIGSTITTLDPEKRDAGQPVVKAGPNTWGRARALGDHTWDIFADNQMLEYDLHTGVRLPTHEKNDFTPEELADINRQASRQRAEDAASEERYQQRQTEREAEEAASAAEATPEAAPQEPLVEGTQDELKIPGVRKQAKRDDKSKQHVKALDKLEAGDRVSHTNARGEKSTYQKHADGTWDEIDPNDEFPEDSPIREAIPASEIADIHKRGDLKVTKEGEEEEADAPSATPAPAPAPAPAPEATPEVAPEPDAAPEVAEEAPSEVQYSRLLHPDIRRAVISAASEEDSGFRVIDGKDLEVTDLEKARDAFSKIAAEYSHPGTSRASNISRNRVLREARSMLVRMNEAIADRDSTEFAKPVREDQKFDGSGLKANQKSDKAPEAGQEPSDEQAPEFGDEPEEQEDVAPISDEQAGRVLETLTSENPLPEGIERHVPEAVEGEDYAPTQQQQDVIDAVLGGLDTLVQAKAGAGKTSTLRAIARRLKLSRPDAKVGYIAFNKSVQLEANATMPNNTEARTGHSIAMAWAQEWMQKRLAPKTLQNPQGFLSRPSDWSDHLGIRTPLDNNGKAFSPNSQAMAVKRTLDAYAFSKDDTIGGQHLPESVREMPEHVQDAVLEFADAAWGDMKDRNGKLRMTLDQIRKQWALSRPDFSKPGSGLSTPVSVLFLDEAQDTPPVLAKVIADQQNVQKVIVGDADQAIYGFTGATDYLSEAEGDVELPLNKSWRFGPAVADMGNRFLQIAESPQRVIGGGESKIVENMTDADAVLVRSNGGMLGEIGSELERGRIVGVSEKTKDDLKALIATARYLRDGGRAPRTLHEDLADFHSWGEFLKEVENGDDQNLAKISRMIETFGLDKMDELVDSVVATGGSVFNAITFEDHPTAGLIARGDTFPARTFMRDAGFRWVNDPSGAIIPVGRNNAGQREKVWAAQGTPAQRQAKLDDAKQRGASTEPDVVISTAHKAKGLEWDRVRIGDDFWAPKVDPDTGEVEMVKPEELRLNYVAVTRAAKELDLGSLAWVLDHSDENGGEVRNDSSEDSAPSLQSEDEDRTKSPVKEAPEEVAPEEAPVVESTPEATPAVDEIPEVVDAPEAEAVPEVPSYNENGLTDVEQATLDYANGRLDRARAGSDTARIDDLEREVNNIMSHGERRNAGETLPEYDPEQIQDDAEEVFDVEEAPESTVPVPMGRRTRRNYDGVILNDENGNALAYGDIVGHRTRGPVQVTTMVSSTGRIGFKVLKTGKTGTVEAHRVTRISSADGSAPATPEEVATPSFDYPTTPGEVYIDPTTGKKAYVDAGGNRVSIGDRVIETRTGKAGKVRGIYQTGQGKAWPRIDFDNGEDRRVTFTKVAKEGAPKAATVTAPEVTPEAAPAAPEVAPEAPAIRSVPDEAPEIPERVTPTTIAPNTVPTASYYERKTMLRGAPVGTTVSRTGRLDDSWAKTGDNEWTNGFDKRTASNDNLAIRMGNSYRDWTINPETDEAPAVVQNPVTHGFARDVDERRAQVQSLPIGATVSNNGITFTKSSPEEWNTDTGGRYSNSDMTFELGYSREDWIVATDQTPIQLAGFPDAVVDENTTPLVGEKREIRARLNDAALGDTVTSAARTFKKIEPNIWEYDYNGSIMQISSSRMSEIASQTEGWTITKNHLPAPPPFSGTLPNERYAREQKLGTLPVGTIVEVNNFTFEKVANGRWETAQDAGQPYDDRDVSWSGSPLNPGIVIPLIESDHDVTVPHDLAENRHARRKSIKAAPVGSTVTGSNGRTYVKRDENSWDDITFGVTGYNENDMVALTALVSGKTFAINPDAEAATTTGIHPALPKGTFLPNSEGSTSGLRKVDDDRWELMLNGQPTGRFSNDDNAQMMMDMNGTAPVVPVIDNTFKVDFGSVDYGVSDLGLGGRTFGDWILENRGSFGDLTMEQRQAIKNGYARFTADLNTRLPDGVTARESGDMMFMGNNLQHNMSFYDKDGRHLGDATRDYNSAFTDARTGEKVNHVHHSLYQISDQGGGISSAFLKASKEFYRQLGMDRITVMAALSVGGYAWARGGFDYESPSAMAQAVNSWSNRRATRPARGQSQAEFDALVVEWDALVARATPENYANGTHPMPRDFTNVGRPSGPTTKDTKWYGKDALVGSVWHGEFQLNPERMPNPHLINSGPVTEVAEAAPAGV